MKNQFAKSKYVNSILSNLTDKELNENKIELQLRKNLKNFIELNDIENIKDLLKDNYEFIKNRPHFNTNYIFTLICSMRNIEILKWMLEFEPKIYLTNLSIIILCESNNLVILKWLCTIFKINLSFENELPFRICCERGHFEMAKFLLKIKPDINVAALDNYAFILATKKRHYDVALWLYKINSTIGISELDKVFKFNHYFITHAKNDGYNFYAKDPSDDKKIYNNNQTYEMKFILELSSVLKFVHKLKPYRYKLFYNEFNDNIILPNSYICNIEEETANKKEFYWNKRKLPIWIASNYSPNKNCLLYKLPCDLAREIIKFI